jgi:hypothetical protein
MSHKKLARKAPCPCGSGKKYKACCWDKGFEWVEDDDGTIYKSTPMTQGMADILQEQRQRFIDKYGREPGPNDPVFLDMPPLEHIEHQTVEAMKEAGIDPAFIYAFEKTGLLLTEENQHLIPEEDLADWDAAIEEYEMKHRKRGKPPDYPIGTVAMYGPNDRTTTKIAAGVILHDGDEAIIKRWVATDVTTNPKVQQEMQDFFLQHGVKSVAMSEGNMGCPHEEGLDFPHGEDCPFCPFWKGKQGSNRMD